MSDKLQFVVVFGSVRVVEAGDKLKFVGHFGGTDRSYSQRNAIIGFTFAARRAGIQQAINPAIAISNATAPYVAGSFVLKPKSMLFTTCDAAIEMGTPIKTPIRTNF